MQRPNAPQVVIGSIFQETRFNVLLSLSLEVKLSRNEGLSSFTPDCGEEGVGDH